MVPEGGGSGGEPGAGGAGGSTFGNFEIQIADRLLGGGVLRVHLVLQRIDPAAELLDLRLQLADLIEADCRRYRPTARRCRKPGAGALPVSSPKEEPDEEPDAEPALPPPACSCCT